MLSHGLSCVPCQIYTPNKAILNIPKSVLTLGTIIIPKVQFTGRTDQIPILDISREIHCVPKKTIIYTRAHPNTGIPIWN